MVSSIISVPMMISAALILFNSHQFIVYCDGEQDSLEATGVPVENNQQQDMEDHLPSAGSADFDATTPPSHEEANPVEDPMATASSEDSPEVSSDQNDEAHQPSTMGADDQNSGDDAGTTTSYDMEIPSEEPDKFGEELIATCKAQADYQGDFSDPNESSRELKCFYACALVRMDVMMEEDGQINFNEDVANDIVVESLGDNTEIIEKYKSAITACHEEVPKGEDRCEYAFAFITCGIQKLSG